MSSAEIEGGGGATGWTRRGTILIRGAMDLSVAFVTGIGVMLRCTGISGGEKNVA